MKKVITRFAPSPTGTLHIGGVRTALFNYVFSKQNNGLFLIRIEDTDKERSKKEYEKNILDSLISIGLKPDKDPINQSNRTDIYKAAAQKIFDSGNAYYCNCSIDRLDELRNEQQAKGIKPGYDGKCRNLNLTNNGNCVLRLKTPQNGELIMRDYVRGEIRFDNKELDDLIILRSDGTPTYHLCNVVDDYEQEVTTVIRGEDHISNTPRQIHIQNALGYPSLEYAHLPLVLGPDKKRLSKRHAATSLAEYRQEGYLDDAILNTLARLGWSKGDNEVFTLEDLIRDFDINEIQKAGAVFDKSKLDYLNVQHLAKLSTDDFKKTIQPFLIDVDIDINSHPQPDKLINAMRTSGNTLLEIALSMNPYFKNIEKYDEKAIGKFIKDKNILIDLIKIIEKQEIWDEESLDIMLQDFQSSKNLNIPQVNQPIRIALTGSTRSPSLGLTMSLFSKNKVLSRINDLLKFI